MPAQAVFSPGYECDIGPHVFPTVKYRYVRDALVAAGALAAADVVEPPPATREELLRAHTPEYLDDLEALRWTPRTVASELPLDAGVVRAYVLGAGGTLLASRLALRDGFGVHLGGGFHHAFADRAEGFCYLNDLAVAVRALQHEGVVARAAIVDLDVHQGNGTAAIFAADPQVYTMSVHQEMNYPVPKQRSKQDVGLPDGTDDAGYLAALAPALESVWAFEPEIVLYQAGADPYFGDLLGGLALTFAGLARRDRVVLDGCDARRIPAVVTLGGGYARDPADTIRIHATTCAIALAHARARTP